MSRVVLSALLASAVLTMPALAQPLSLDPPGQAEAAPAAPPPTRVAAARPNMGGGFIEFLFGGGGEDTGPPTVYPASAQPYAVPEPAAEEAARPPIDPRFLPQTIAYDGPEAPGTIIIDTPQHFLYLVQPGGAARR
jgi:lipoprotein-anchoring transpeptidase ErfK/SrfK